MVLREEGDVRGVPGEERCRADVYGLLAALLASPPDDGMLVSLADLTGDETVLGQALAALAERARRTDAAAADDEYHRLFIGLTEGELRPYASFYLTGLLYERPLASLRRDMEILGIVRALDSAEPEDHIAALMEMMQGLILGTFGDPVPLQVQKAFFDAHVLPWASRFFADLETATDAALYRPVGTIGRTFMAIEREAFDLLG
ncbi:MAG: molecular chaperone TorD [Rhodospirillales bacterium]|nr:MAG: molecular chaperone TorD [Rhodospirillales bacterium]